MKRTYVCLPGAWMGAWSWKFVIEGLAAAGHEATALPFRGVGERAALGDGERGLFAENHFARVERHERHHEPAQRVERFEARRHRALRCGGLSKHSAIS